MKTAKDFRQFALSLPQTVESSHMDHPDFRVSGKIFATLGYPNREHGMVILPPDEQAQLVRAQPKVFAAGKGAWGKKGCTIVRLETVSNVTLQSALKIAWRNKAPKIR